MSRKYCNGNFFYETVKSLVTSKNTVHNGNIVLRTDSGALTRTFNQHFTNIAQHIGLNDTIEEGDDVTSRVDNHDSNTSIKNINAYMQLAGQVTQRFHLQKANASIILTY